MASLSCWIWFFNWLPSFVVMLAAITGLVTPHARPRAAFDGTNTYGTFLSSARRGKWSKISIGSVSAAMMTTSLIPLLRVLVAAQSQKDDNEWTEIPDMDDCNENAPSFAPFLICL